MGLQMEEPASICTTTLIRNIIQYLTKNDNTDGSVIKINSDNLQKNGELYFLLSFKAWKTTFKNDHECNEQCTTVLQHFWHKQGGKTEGTANSDIIEEVLQQLILDSRKWSLNIKKCSLEKERVCIFLNRSPIIRCVIKAAVEQGKNFGRGQFIDKVFCFKIREDKESELTTTRLQLLKSVTEKLLRLSRCRMSDEQGASNIIFTTRSEGKVEEEYKKYVCGVVKNSETNTKDTSLSWDEHINKKIKELRELNEHKLFEDHQLSGDTFVKNIATATAILELLAVKPSRPVFIGHDFVSDKSITNTKGAPFILYNTARIATIISKYNDRRLKGEYPDLPSIDNIDFSCLEQEDDWELIYNFIVGYPQMLQEAVKFEPVFQTSPHVISIFLSRLCQKFSVYYRKTRILTEGYDHLLPAMFARLYMIQALHTVLQNTLDIFQIQPISHM